MRIRILLALAVGLVFGAPSVGAQSIGLYSSPDCSSCSLDIPLGSTATIYINYSGNLVEPVGGAEFRVVGLPPDWQVVSVTLSPAANVRVGDPMGAGTNIGFPVVQPGDCVNLFAVQIRATSAASDVVLRVTRHTTPSLLEFQCPVVAVYCDCDVILCVGGGQMRINSGTPCTVAVVPATWTQVRKLYR